MSAICGMLHRDRRPVFAVDLAPMLDALQGYGSEIGQWAPGTGEAPVGLGCRPWRVTPEDAWYHPPLRSSDGQLVLVADARIDNREELAAVLGIDAVDASRTSDADFILAAYQAWGLDCGRRLHGDFAFLLWDGRRQSLVAVRDGLGQRVLFYHQSASRVALATSAHALARLPDVHPRLNEQKVADFLVLYQEPSSTFFEGIHRVPAGHAMIVTQEGFRTERFWSPEPKRSIRFRSDEEYLEGFRNVFGEAVRARLRCAGQVGVMLSGGLDSATVAAVAARTLAASGRRLRGYHAAPRRGFQAPSRPGVIADEAEDVEAIASLHSNLDLEIQRPDGRTPLASVEQAFLVTGAPARNPNNVAWFEGIYAAARERHISVLLAGHAGNATISYSGLRSLRDAAKRGRWGQVWREVRAHARLTGQPASNVFRDQVVRPLAQPLLTSLSRIRGRHPRPPVWEVTASPISADFAQAMHAEERLHDARRDQRSIGRASELDLRIATLRSPADSPDTYCGFRARFGVETRDPTADLRVVDYCFSIPTTQYLHRGMSRGLVRRAMEGYLPDQVRLRRTRGDQGADWIEWLPRMRPELTVELNRLDRSDTANRCLDLGKLRRLVDRWPDRLGPEQESDYKLLLLRGVMMGRFIRWFEETYR